MAAQQRVHVFARLRPEEFAPLEALKTSDDATEISLEFARGTCGLVTEDETIRYDFKFQRVFNPAALQTDVFAAAVAPCVDQFCDGFGATVFACK